MEIDTPIATHNATFLPLGHILFSLAPISLPTNSCHLSLPTQLISQSDFFAIANSVTASHTGRTQHNVTQRSDYPRSRKHNFLGSGWLLPDATDPAAAAAVVRDDWVHVRLPTNGRREDAR